VTEPSAPRIRMTQQSDGRWIWIREEGAEAINLGWIAPTKAIVGSLVSRMKRPMVEVLAAAIRREYGTDVTVEGREGAEQ
jgi:hypothetical protein